MVGMNTDTLAAVLAEVKTSTVTPVRASGCGRVYVCLSGFDMTSMTSRKVDAKIVKAVAEAAKKVGMIFQRKAHYGMTNALYVGYDNATGRELAKGELLARRLTEAGVPAYCDAHGD